MTTDQLAGLRCLVVDDESSVRYVLSRVLSGVGMVVEEAEDGEAALRRIGEAVPDLIVLDLHMPRVDGVVVLQTLREQGVQVPVIATSGLNTLDDVGALPDDAVHAYLEKPFSRAEVLSAVLNALRVYRGPTHGAVPG